MERTWNEIRQHPVSVSLYLLSWSIAFALDALRWHKPPGRDDMVPAVILMHLLVPVVAGAFVGWWRRNTHGGITGGMIAGACILPIDVAALVVVQLIHHANEATPGGERITEAPVFLIALGLFGSLAGLLGAAAATLLARLLNRGTRVPPVRKTRIIPKRMLLLAAAAMLSVAALLTIGVIPNFTQTSKNRAVMAFMVNGVFNVVIGLTLLILPSPRMATVAPVLVMMAGSVALLLGATLLDAAVALAHGAGSLGPAAACLVGALADLGAAVLCLFAVRRRTYAGCVSG